MNDKKRRKISKVREYLALIVIMIMGLFLFSACTSESTTSNKSANMTNSYKSASKNYGAGSYDNYVANNTTYNKVESENSVVNATNTVNQENISKSIETKPDTSVSSSTANKSSSSTSSTSSTKSSASSSKSVEKSTASSSEGGDYVLNTNTKKFHRPGCSAIKQMKESNKKYSSKSRDEVIRQGYVACKKCNP